MQYCGFGTPSVKVTVYGQKGCRVHPVSTPEMDGVEGNQNRKSILSFCNLTMTLLARYSTERTQLWNGVFTSTCQHIQYNKNGRQTSRMLWGVLPTASWLHDHLSLTHTRVYTWGPLGCCFHGHRGGWLCLGWFQPYTQDTAVCWVSSLATAIGYMENSETHTDNAPTIGYSLAAISTGERSETKHAYCTDHTGHSGNVRTDSRCYGSMADRHQL